MLVVSFGTSYKDTCEKTIGAIEKDLAEAFPDRKLLRAWTSGFIRKKILERDGEKILSPEEALKAFADGGISDVLIVPTHLLSGGEYAKIADALAPEIDKLNGAKLGRPLLETEDDIEAFAGALIKIFDGVEEDEMAVFMGHGSDCIELPVYELLNEAFIRSGHDNFCVGTVEFEPGIEPVLKRADERKPEKIFLSPLLVVAGDHANNDMAGDEPDSWKSILQNRGCEVECILKGLGEYKEIRKLYIDRAKEALGN